MQLDPTKTALVLIEFQNDFATEGGSLHGAVQGVITERALLEAITGEFTADDLLGVIFARFCIGK